MNDADPRYSRRQVDRAGAVLKDDSADPAARREARRVVDFWRSQHRIPLVEMRSLLYTKMRGLRIDGIVAQRLKRFPSVESKLRRIPTMKLSRMQDLGGCRAVVPTVGQVEALGDRWRNGPQKHELQRETDYVASPKANGYRSLHLVYRFRTQSAERRALDRRLIEIQIRSRLQHAWATAVETVDLLQETGLKIGRSGNDDWKRFFALMATAHAMEEESPIVRRTPEARADLRSEVRELSRSLGAQSFLGAIVPVVAQVVKGSGWALVTLRAAVREINIQTYSARQFRRAQEQYLRLEHRHEDDPTVQVCLVSSDDADSLRKAYPNYFLDVRPFVESLRRFLEEPTNA